MDMAYPRQKILGEQMDRFQPDRQRADGR